MFTYIFGAGASYGTLPLATELRNSLNDFIKSLEALHGSLKSIDISPDVLRDFTSTVKSVYLASEKHQTIDTYARMLSLTGRTQEYLTLRNVLTAYFHWIQLHQNVHNRYDHFLATLLEEDKLSIPNDFTLLSWNYDIQFEMAISMYLNNIDYSTCFNHLNKRFDYNRNLVSDKAFIKLNGTAFFQSQSDGEFNSNKIIDFSEIHGELLRYIVRLSDNLGIENATTSLSFAWSEEKATLIKNIKDRLENTQILVIIGYSFPYFNRKIDLQILSSLKRVGKVIIQAPKENALDLKSKVAALWPTGRWIEDKIEVVTDTTQFFIPYEYNNPSQPIQML